MSQEVKRRRGTTAQHATFTGAEGEITIDTDKKVAVVHDGATAGGIPQARADQVLGKANNLADLPNPMAARRSIGVFSVRDFATASVARPLYIAHRSQALLYPDQSVGAYRQSALSPLVDALECDVRKLSDGTLVNFHDSTLDRVTDGTGSVEALDVEEFKSLYIDAEVWHGANIADGQAVSFFSDVLDEFRGRKLIVPEVKTSGAGQDVVDALVAHGVGPDQAIVQAFNLADLEPAVEAGYPAMFLTDSSASIAAAITAGVAWVGIDQTAADAVFSAWISAGFKTVAWTVNRRFRRDELLGLGVVGFFTDDVEYLARNTPVRTRDTFSTAAWMPGMLGVDDGMTAHRRGRMLMGGWGQPDLVDPGVSPNFVNPTIVLQGWACPVGNKPDADNYAVEWTATFLGAGLSGSWGSLAIASAAMGDRHSRDGGTNNTFPSDANEQVMHLLVRDNGFLDIYKRTGTDAVRLSRTESGLVILPGQSVRIRAEVLPSTITLKRLDASGGVLAETQVEDADYRSGYFHFGVRTNAKWVFSDVSVLAAGQVSAAILPGSIDPVLPRLLLNLDDPKTPFGFYRVQASLGSVGTLPAISGSLYGTVLIERYDANYCVQWYTYNANLGGGAGGKTFKRLFNAVTSAWTTWTEV